MSFEYREGRLMVEHCPLLDIAEQYDTPAFVYSRALLTSNYRAYRRGFGTRKHQICYAVKANGNLAILDVLSDEGAAFDIVSSGELARVRAAGGDPRLVTFAGVGKSADEMAEALAADIRCFNVESVNELEQLDQVARRLGKTARVAIRVNPDVDARTHPYISTGLSQNKFGVPMDDALAVYRRAGQLEGIAITGVACHIGSQLTTVAPIVDAAERVMVLVETLEREGFRIDHVDVGGGLGISYGYAEPPDIERYVHAICAVVPPRYEIVIEPGRSIVGAAGVLLTRVLYVKRTRDKVFAVCDAAMTELIRPALYQAHHDILNLVETDATETVDVVGPVCETADFLAKDRRLTVHEGDYLAVMDCGAYAAVMASNYNARPRPVELLVDGDAVHVARDRESVTQLFAGEYRISLPREH